MDVSTVLPAARTTAEAIFGRTGALFSGEGPIYEATMAIDSDARVPRNVHLLKAGRQENLLAKVGNVDSASSTIRSVCLKFPDTYGQRRDQDFLLASSGDGAPLHHVTLPTTSGGAVLYSSLWLYLAGIAPVLFGLRTSEGEPREGTVAEFCVSAPVGKFHRIGTVTFERAAQEETGLTFAARNSGGNIRPLPPVSFY